MTDPARAIRETLLSDARSLGARQCILCCMPVRYRPARLRHLLAAVRSLGELTVAAFDLHLLTDADTAGERETLRRLCAPMLPHGRLAVHACAGTVEASRCQERFVTDVFLAPDSGYDLFLHLADDLVFGMNNLAYWLAARPALAPMGLRPAFLRCEYDDRSRRFHTPDMTAPAVLAAARPLAFADWLFVRPETRHDGPCILDRPLAERYLGAPAPDRGRGREAGIRDDAEQDGWRPAIPFDARTLVPAPECCVLYLPDDDARRPEETGGTGLPLDRLLQRTPLHPPASAGPPGADLPAGLPAGLALHRHALREAIAADASARAAHGIISVRTAVPAGHYRRAPPLLVDTSAVSAAERPVCARALGCCMQEYEPILLATLRDACLVGEGTVVTAAGMLVDESCWEFFAQRLPLPGMIAAGDGSLRLPNRPHRTIAGPALLMKRPFVRNYGHWLFDVALPLALAVAEGLRADMPIIVGGSGAGPGYDAMIAETLRLLAPGVPVLDHPDDELWRIGELHYLFPVGRTPLFRLPQAIAALRGRLLADLPPTPRRRLFVTRAGNPRRRLPDEAALFALCAEFGFERVAPEEHSLQEQAAMFHAAEAIVGVKGAALTNVLFCRPGTPMIVLSPAGWWEPLFWDLAGQLGCPYLEIFGPLLSADQHVSYNPFRIDHAALRRALGAILPSEPSFPPEESAPERTRAAIQEREAPLVEQRRSASSHAERPLVPEPPIGPSAPPAIHPPHPIGEDVRDMLGRLHAMLAPRRYLELGTGGGETLLLSHCPTIAVDPDFRLDQEVATRLPLLFLFPLTSDDFFRRHDPVALLSGPPDLVFIARCQSFEAVLRDIINIERHAHPGTVLVLRGGMPHGPAMAGHDPAEHPPVSRQGWEGDAWMLPGMLRHYRPDLDIRVFDAAPAALVVIRGLDPHSRVLSGNYAAIVAATRTADGKAAFVRHAGALGRHPGSSLEQVLTAGTGLSDRAAGRL